MKPRWKTFLLYGSLVIIVGCLVFILIETIRAKNTGFETKTLWDWMELLIIPLVLAGGVFYLNWSERQTEREITKDRQQEDALQAYFDRISELLLEKKLRSSEETEARNVARTRTISILRVLDKERKDIVIQFLREANLITDENSILNGANMDRMNLQGLDLYRVYMQDARLYDAYLQGASLMQANLKGTRLPSANLKNLYVGEANLQGTSFVSANLKKAFMGDANLQSASLKNAELQGAWLQDANLQGADLEDADLRGAELNKANLRGANLQKARVTDAQLAKVLSLKGAIMPDGTKHE